jgi:hypothetical protein
MAGRFPLLLDQHIPQALAQALRERGWAVVRVVDLKRELGPCRLWQRQPGNAQKIAADFARVAALSYRFEVWSPAPSIRIEDCSSPLQPESHPEGET